MGHLRETLARIFGSSSLPDVIVDNVLVRNDEQRVCDAGIFEGVNVDAFFKEDFQARMTSLRPRTQNCYLGTSEIAKRIEQVVDICSTTKVHTLTLYTISYIRHLHKQHLSHAIGTLKELQIFY